MSSQHIRLRIAQLKPAGLVVLRTKLMPTVFPVFSKWKEASEASVKKGEGKNVKHAMMG